MGTGIVLNQCTPTYRAEESACTTESRSSCWTSQLLTQLRKLSKRTRLTSVDIMLYGQSSADLARVSSYSFAVLHSCVSLPGACLRKPVRQMYRHKEHDGPRAYSLSCSCRNHCQNFSGFLCEKNQVFRGHHKRYPSGNVSAKWLAISSWLVIPWKMIPFLLGCRLMLHVQSSSNAEH